MSIGENISDSLKYPLQDWTKLLILGVIMMIPIVNFIATGYYLRIMKATFAGIDEIPGFDDIGDLLIDGIKILIVGIVYAIVPLIFYVLAFLFAAPAITSYSTDFSYTFMPVFTGISLVFFAIAIILAIIIGLIAYMAIANMALYDSELGAAFRFSEILDRIKAIGWGNYILWWIVFLLVNTILGLIIGIVGGFLMLVLIGILIFILGAGYLIMFQARSVALIFASGEE